VAKSKQLEMFPQEQPPVDLGIIKSSIQKAYRRNHKELMEWSFNWLWRLDPKWLVWRTPIFPAEEAWQNLLETGKIVRQVETKMTTPNPQAMKNCANLLYNHLVETMGTTKNKDGDGMRTIAEIAAQKEGRQREKLVEAVKAKVPEEAHKSLDKMIEVEEFAAKNRFVPKEVWGEIWDRVVSLGERKEELGKTQQDYQDLRDIVGAAYFRGKKGGMVGDRTLLVSVALLAMDDWEYGIYGGLKKLPPSKKVLKEDDFDGNPQSKPPVWCIDMHTGYGKRMLAYLAKKYPYQKMALDWVWFIKESARVNETDPTSIWWPLAEKVVPMALGFNLKQLNEEIWPEMWELIQKKIGQWLEEESK